VRTMRDAWNCELKFQVFAQAWLSACTAAERRLMVSQAYLALAEARSTLLYQD